MKKNKGMEMNRRAFFETMPFICTSLSFGLIFNGVLGNKEEEDAYIKRWEAYCNKHCPGVLNGKEIITKNFIETMMRFAKKEMKLK